MIIILEGISKTGKSTWFNRNKEYLENIWPNVKKTHLHDTERGSALKRMYFDTIKYPTPYGKSNLLLQYAAIHLHHAMNFTPVPHHELRVLDRSIVSTFCISLPQMLETFKEHNLSISANTIEYMLAATQIYFDGIQDALGGTPPIIVYFDGSVEDKRYAGMELEQSFYSKFFYKNFEGPSLIQVDASKSIEEVDVFIKCELNNILVGKNGNN